MKKLVTLAALAALLVPSLACAQQMLTLKGAPASGDAQVTVGDVFDNAGPLAKVLLGYRSAATVILDAATVQSVVGANGGYWANPRGQHRIVVTAAAAGSRPAAAAPPPPENPFAPASAGATPVAMSASPFTTAPAAAPLGAAPSVAPPAFFAPTATAAAPKPQKAAIAVHRADTIDVTWSADGLSLTMSGVVQKDAAIGDTVAVMNPASKKMIDAVITGPGQGLAGPGADSYRALQLSSR